MGATHADRGQPPKLHGVSIRGRGIFFKLDCNRRGVTALCGATHADRQQPLKSYGGWIGDADVV